MNSLEQSIFDRILGLVQEIPIVDDEFYNCNIDSQIYVSEENAEFLGKQTVSFRDIVNLIIKLLKDERGESEVCSNLFNNTAHHPIIYPREYLLFNSLLEGLAGEIDYAKMHLDLSYNFLGLSENFKLLLSIVLNYNLTDKDLRKFLVLLASSIEPYSARCHIDMYGDKYKNRYENYRKELESIRNDLA